MVMITGGFRYQKIDADNFSNTTGVRTGGYSSDAVSPLAGIVFKPVSNVALYFNYAEGLSQGAVVPQTQSAPFNTVPYANAGQTLAPYKSKQLEGGVKVDWGTITTTASYFEITRPSLITLNPGLPIATQAYDGEQNNHGIELNAYGLVMPGLRGMVSYTYLIPELTKVSSTLLNTLGKDAVEGLYATGLYETPYEDLATPPVKAWIATHRKMFGGDPNTQTIYGYNAIMNFACYAKMAGKNLNGETMLAALESGKGCADIFGDKALSYSKTNHLHAITAQLHQIKGGRWVTLSRELPM